MQFAARTDAKQVEYIVPRLRHLSDSSATDGVLYTDYWHLSASIYSLRVHGSAHTAVTCTGLGIVGFVSQVVVHR